MSTTPILPPSHAVMQQPPPPHHPVGSPDTHMAAVSHQPSPSQPRVPMIPSTCTHLNNFFDRLFYSHTLAGQQAQQQGQAMPPLPPQLADLHSLFAYLRHLSLTPRRPQCNVCKRFSGRLHACVGCVFIGCSHLGHIQSHAKESSHWCYVDIDISHRLGIYCIHCRDYVYHREIIKIQEQSKIGEQRRRRRREESFYHQTDLATIKQFALSHCDDDALLGLRGIFNLGNTCYMSVILQSFIHNNFIRNYFLCDLHNQRRCTRRRSDNGSIAKTGICLACDMDDLFGAFYSGDHSPFTPQRYVLSIWNHSEHLAGYQQQDAHELLMAMLNGLHSDTHTSTNINNDIQINNDGKSCPCVIHTVFGGLLRSDVQCGTCAAVSTAFDPCFDVSVDLMAVKQSLQSPRPPSTTTPTSADDPHRIPTLTDCLKRFTSTEKLYSHDKFLCRHCSNYTDATKQFSFSSLPLVLIIHCKRFERKSGAKGSMKIDDFVSFPLAGLEMSHYLHHQLPTPLSPATKIHSSNFASSDNDGQQRRSDPSQSNLYHCFCVIVHKGNLENGHYICYFKRASQWFKNDDRIIVKVSESEVCQSQAYLLFYQKHAVSGFSQGQ